MGGGWSIIHFLSSRGGGSLEEVSFEVNFTAGFSYIVLCRAEDVPVTGGD